MADAEKESPKEVKSEKIFTTKAIIVFAVAILVWTGALMYFLKGMTGKPDAEVAKVSDNGKLFAKLINEQSQVHPVKIDEIIVPIKIDKNGDTTKMLSVSFAIYVGLTAKEQKAIDENKWPPELEKTRFGIDDITEAQYTDKKVEWSLKTSIEGHAGEGGGHGGSKGDNPDAYVSIIRGLESEIRAQIIELLQESTWGQVNTADGRHTIKNALKDEINGLLKEQGKYPRVYKVDITQFIPQ